MTYPAQLERLLNEKAPKSFSRGQRFEVLNLGVGNYNTVQEVMRLRNVGLAFHPDLVTMGWFINDAEPTPHPPRGFLMEHSYLFALLASRKNVLSPRTGTWDDYYRNLYNDDQPGWKVEQDAFGDLAMMGRDSGVPVIMFLLPELHDLTNHCPFAEIYDRVANTGRAKGLQVVDLFPQFAGYKPETKLWVTPLDAHPNAEAEGMIARGMYDALDRLAEPPHAVATKAPN
jgi:hypothetical protein